MVPDAQKALGADIRLLGNLLGQAIRRLAGDVAFDLEEEIRAAAKELRANPSPDAARELRDRLGTLDLPALRGLIRAFSVFFDLINLAEQQARVRALRHRAAKPDGPRAETAEAALRRIAARGVPAEEVADHLARGARRAGVHRPPERGPPAHRAGEARVRRPPARRAGVRVAHAGRARRRDRVHRRGGRSALADRRGSVRAAVRARRGAASSRAGRSAPARRRAAGVPEARSGTGAGLPRSRPAACPRSCDSGRGSAATATATRTSRTRSPPTRCASSRKRSSSTTSTASRSWAASSATPTPFVEAGPALAESLAADAKLFPGVSAGKGHEPYRAKCRMIAAKLRRTLEYVRAHVADWGAEQARRRPACTSAARNCSTDLALIADDLRRAGATASRRRRRPRLRSALVEVFGLHLLTLDIRQHSGRHESAVGRGARRPPACAPNYLRAVAGRAVRRCWRRNSNRPAR